MLLLYYVHEHLAIVKNRWYTEIQTGQNRHSLNNCFGLCDILINYDGDNMKKKLFGNNIAVSCVYCEHSKTEGESQYCTKNKSLKNGKCSKFKYNPIMREPKGMAPLKSFSKEDFEL